MHGHSGGSLLYLHLAKSRIMNIELKDRFLTLWEKYFGKAELPITFQYITGDGGAERAEKSKGRSCLICELARVRSGRSVYYNNDSLTCSGAKRYLGYTDKMRPGFEYFLSCGNDQMEGERYLRNPEMVKEFMKNQVTLPVAGKNIVFKRWDNLTPDDNPDVVIFFARPDILSGLFTLANYDQTDPNGTITPFSAGCGSIIHYPFLESMSERQRAVIGLFDPSARPCVQAEILTFAVPLKRFERMISFMDESFLMTRTWTTVRNRISK
jgi:uncharacterized protein (DUF169 family)